MNIKIDLVVSASPELLNALQALSGPKTIAVAKDPIPIDNGEVKKTRKVKVASEPLNVSDKEIEAMEREEKEMREKENKEEIKTDLTLEAIIADAVPKSKAGHKDKIKAKVTELGYESITDLQITHFDEFWSFLQTISKPA